MLILGIDPGTATTGFGVIESNGEGLKVLDWGLIETDKTSSTGKRLELINSQMTAILSNHKPDVVTIEKIFFARNAKTAIAVGQASGVMIFTASKLNIKVVEYAPMTIKKIVTGSGKSDKKEVQQHIRKILGNGVRSKAKKRTHFDNAADALAIALCHAMSIKGGEI